jgi:hypothetical protein
VSASSSTPTRVAARKRHRKPAGYLIRVKARAGGSDDRDSSPRAGILSIRVNLPANQSVAVLPTSGNWISAVSSLGRVTAARVLERGGPLSCARTLAAIFQGYAGTGGLGTAILAGAKSTTGKCFSLLRALVQLRQKSTSCVFHALEFPPVGLPSLLAAHESNVAKGLCHERQVTCKG